jgi:hypothetical protein
MRSWSQGDAPATCEISLVLTSVLWLKHRHFTHFSWAILKVLPSGETRKMNLCGTQNSQFLDVFGSVVFGSPKNRFSRENDDFSAYQWGGSHGIYRLAKEFQATPKGLGFQTFHIFSQQIFIVFYQN